jgi:hypothetical protein
MMSNQLIPLLELLYEFVMIIEPPGVEINLLRAVVCKQVFGGLLSLILLHSSHPSAYLHFFPIIPCLLTLLTNYCPVKPRNGT